MPDVPDFCFPFLQTTTTLRNSSCVRKDPEERFGENPQPQFWYSHSTVHFFFHISQISASVWGSEGGFSAWKRPGGSNLPQLGRPPLRNWWTCWLFPFCPSRPSSPPLAPSQTPPLCQLLPPPTQWQIEEWFDGTDLSLINPKLTMFHDPIFKYYYMNQLSLSQLIIYLMLNIWVQLISLLR